MSKPISRRSLLAASLALAPTILVPVRARAAAQWTAKQIHAQPANSHLQHYLEGLWGAVRKETGGRLDVTVYPSSMGIADAGTVVLRKVISGEIEFHVLMGSVFGLEVPAMEIQSLPFAFRTSEQVARVMDGPLGDYLHREMRAKGLYGFSGGLMENGFRQMVSIHKPVRAVEDLNGYRMRVPAGRMVKDFFESLGAVPVTVNLDKLYESLRTNVVDGQENPLVVTEENKLYEVSKYVSVTNHIWSGFNIYGNLKFWNSLPPDVQAIVERNVKKYAALQRVGVRKINRALAARLAEQGLVFNTVDTAPFRAHLGSGFYQRWKQEFGAEPWGLLEAGAGKLV